MRRLAPYLSRRSATIALLLIAAIAGVAYARAAHASARGEASEPDVRPAIASVAVVRATRRDLSKTIKLTSELLPFESVKLYAKEAGYLREIDVDYGSRVTAGETIARLDLPEQAADLDKSDAAYALAKVDYERVASVDHANPGLIAQADVDKAKTDYLMAQDQRDRASIVTGYRLITAPFGGVVTKRYVDPGALIAQGTTSDTASPIVEIADTYRLRLVIQTPETLVPQIRVGMPVTIDVTTTGETIHGHVARFSYDLHEETRTMHTEVDVPNGDLHLKPGMYATATFVLASQPHALSLPTQAVAQDPSPDVWVVDRDDRLARRAVTLGMQTPDYIAIDRGLRDGERVFVGDRTDYELGTKVDPKPFSEPLPKQHS